MSDAPATVVQMDFALADADDFILDDPVRGVLDNSTYVLSDGFTDLSEETSSISIQRGRFSRLFDEFPAGSATLIFNNEDRDFDPTYTSSPYYGHVIPGRRVRIVTADIPIFTGKIEDWDFEYNVSLKSNAVAQAVDALGVAGYAQFNQWTPPVQFPGPRLHDVADRTEVQIGPTERNFDTGIFTLQSAVVDAGTNVLNYMQLVAQSDLGYLYATADGILTFRDRQHSANNAVSVASFALADVPFDNLTATYGTETLYGRVSVTRAGGVEQVETVDDPADFAATYGGMRSLSISGLLLETDDQAASMAAFILGIFDTPMFRFDSLTVQLGGLTPAQQSTILGIDITDMVDITFTPNNVGSAITQDVLVQGIRHDIGIKSHLVTFSFVDVTNQQVFQLDSADFGRLDIDALAL